MYISWLPNTSPNTHQFFGCKKLRKYLCTYSYFHKMCFSFISLFFLMIKKEMLKGSVFFLPFSSLIQTIKHNSYNDWEEKYNFLYTFKYALMMMKTIREYLSTNWTDLYTKDFIYKIKKHISFNWCQKSIESTFYGDL